MIIAIGSDKSGFELKESLRTWLEDNDYEYVDLGTRDLDHVVPYYEVAPRLADELASGRAGRGILCCGTGQGMAIVANKHAGIRATCCESVYAAKMARAINDANILCLGGWLTASWLGREMAKVFLTTEFTQDLEDWRRPNLQAANDHIMDYEKRMFTASEWDIASDEGPQLDAADDRLKDLGL